MSLAVLAVAVACAVRGLWSPCGLSMLSTLTPLGERARGHSYTWSMCWYVVGALAGGVCLGAALALGSVATSALSLHGGVVARVATALALVVCLAGDAGIAGIQLPRRPRQVNERWLDRFRPWAYASGFGWQIGSGFTTYVMTDALYALAVASMLLSTPVDALVVGTLFGLVRGASLLVGSRVGTPDALRALHTALARLAPWSIGAPACAELALLLVLASHTGGAWLRLAVGAVGLLFVLAVVRHAHRTTEAVVVPS